MQTANRIQDGRVALRQHDLQQAFQMAIAALKSSPVDGQGWLLLADVLRASGQGLKAMDHYSKASRFLDDPIPAWQARAAISSELHLADDCIEACKQLISLSPGDVDLRVDMAQMVNDLGAIPQSIVWLEEALKLDPGHAPAHMKLGFIRENRAEYERAEEHFQHVLDLIPGCVDAMVGLARIAIHHKDLAQARRLLTPCLKVDPPHLSVAVTWAEFCLAERSAEKALPYLERALSTLTTLGLAPKRILTHRYARVLDQAKRYGEAFEAFRQANALAAPARGGATALVDLLISRFSGFEFSQTETSAEAEHLVFIVGMPRSGSSLVEQILSAHPEIYGGGEMEALRTVIHGAGRTRGYPTALHSITEADLSQWREDYYGQIPAVKEAIVTDKMPRNALFLGMLAMLFPGARVIHTRRDPVDTCWSCYRQVFGNGLDYTTDLTTLGEHHLQIDRLMAFWKTHLPLRFLDVNYEELVTCPEEQMLRLVEFTGQPWDDRCAEFHKSGRRISTSSRGQADSKLYTSGIHNAAPYHPYLGELFAALQIAHPDPDGP